MPLQEEQLAKDALLTVVDIDAIPKHQSSYARGVYIQRTRTLE